jgi:hypothetical protein
MPRLQLCILAIVLGVCIAFASQFVWANTTTSEPAAKTVICEATDCGNNLPQSIVKTEGRPFGFVRVSYTSQASLDSPGTFDISNKTTTFEPIGFIASSLAWGVAAYVVVRTYRFVKR